MLFGSLIRICGFALYSGLFFLLAPQEPRIYWLGPQKESAWTQAQSTVLAGLRRVKEDLDRVQTLENSQVARTGQLHTKASKRNTEPDRSGAHTPGRANLGLGTN
jgi:hypothetical protein